jgi:hypothetical protein
MASSTDRYVVRFAVHVDGEYRKNYFGEMSDDWGVITRELSDGRIELTGFQPKKSTEVLDHLKQEQRRGWLIIEDDCSN